MTFLPVLLLRTRLALSPRRTPVSRFVKRRWRPSRISRRTPSAPWRLPSGTASWSSLATFGWPGLPGAFQRSGVPRPNRALRPTVRVGFLRACVVLRSTAAFSPCGPPALDGSWQELGLAFSAVLRTALCDFREGVLSTPSTTDSRPVPDWGVPVAGCLAVPLTSLEVHDALRQMRGSAPGPAGSF